MPSCCACVCVCVVCVVCVSTFQSPVYYHLTQPVSSLLHSRTCTWRPSTSPFLLIGGWQLPMWMAPSLTPKPCAKRNCWQQKRWSPSCRWFPSGISAEPACEKNHIVAFRLADLLKYVSITSITFSATLSSRAWAPLRANGRMVNSRLWRAMKTFILQTRSLDDWYAHAVEHAQVCLHTFEGNAFILASYDHLSFPLHLWYSRLQRRLKELIGAPAGKLHTGRSRNDQVRCYSHRIPRHAIIPRTTLCM